MNKLIKTNGNTNPMRNTNKDSLYYLNVSADKFQSCYNLNILIPTVINESRQLVKEKK